MQDTAVVYCYSCADALADGCHLDYTVDAMFCGWFNTRFHVTQGILTLCEGDTSILMNLMNHLRDLSREDPRRDRWDLQFRDEVVVLVPQTLGPDDSTPVLVLALASED